MNKITQTNRELTAMLSADSFFDLKDFSHAELFQTCDFAWDALKSLKTYIDGKKFQELPSELFRNHIPLQTTVVYYGNLFYSSDEFDIDFGDATKGNLKVYRKGELLEGDSAGPGCR